MQSIFDGKIGKEKKIDPLRFEISGNLIRKFGGESISNKNIAILELLKNSFDAGAGKVDLNFSALGTHSAKIEISDDGDGMEYSDLKNRWMRIANPFKAKNLRNGNRTYIGEKGIGRLSSESLGHAAVLHSFPKGKDVGYKIDFDWDEYQKEGILVNDVDNPTFQFSKKKSDHGVQLSISRLNHDWYSKEAQKSLLEDINLLNPPNKQMREFRVSTKFNSSFEVPQKIKKDFLDKAAYKLKAKLVGGSLIQYEFSSISGFKDSGEMHIKERLRCGDAVFELFFFYKSPTYLEKAIDKKISPAESKEINKILSSYSGIKLYRDNFRVKPYGEPNNDWIGLDIAAHNNSMYPRNDAIFGMVHIGKSKNSAISDTTTREGVIHTPEFQDLISFVRFSIFDIFSGARSQIESHKIKAKKKRAGLTKKKPVSISAASTNVTPTAAQNFLDIGGKYPENFYSALHNEINICYEHNHPNATFFLCRKMVENLVFNILEKNFPKRVDLWFDPKNGIRLKFSLLVANLYKERNGFAKPNVKNYIEKFNVEVGPFRKEANTKAHNVYEYLGDKKELDRFKIKDLVQLLVKIYDNI